MKEEHILEIVDAINNMERTLRHALGDCEMVSDMNNVGNIMYSMDRMSDNIVEINERLKVLDDSVIAVAQEIRDK